MSDESPRVIAIQLSKASRAPLHSIIDARALTAWGLEGDRHARRGQPRQVLVVEREVLDELGLVPGDIREQLTVLGLDLSSLSEGTRLRIGAATFEVAEPCEPCIRMDQIRPGLQAQLEGRRGRFVRVAEGGSFRVGDPIVVIR